MLRGLLGLCCVLYLSVSGYGGQRVYDFDDGTLQDWQYVNLDGDPYPAGDLEGGVYHQEDQAGNKGQDNPRLQLLRCPAGFTEHVDGLPGKEGQGDQAQQEVDADPAQDRIVAHLLLAKDAGGRRGQGCDVGRIVGWPESFTGLRFARRPVREPGCIFCGNPLGELRQDLVEGLGDLDGFSHVILLCHLHKARPYRLKVIPYLDTEPRGLFATRAPSRPNPIGLSVVELLGISGNTLKVRGLDLLDGTPVLDIKPYLPDLDAAPLDRPGWVGDAGDGSARRQSGLRGETVRALAAVGDPPLGCRARPDRDDLLVHRVRVVLRLL